MPWSLRIIIVLIDWAFLRTRHGHKHFLTQLHLHRKSVTMITRCSSRTRTLKFGSWVTSSRPHSYRRQRGHKTMGHMDTWSTLKHSTPVCPLNGFLGQFTHCKFSPVPLSLINQHWSLETKAYKVEPTWIQSLVLFCKHAIWSVYIEHTQRKGGNQQDRTKTCWCKGCLVFAQMCFQTLLAEPRII